MNYGFGELSVIIQRLQETTLNKLNPKCHKQLSKIEKNYKKINVENFVKSIVRFGFDPRSDTMMHPSQADDLINNHLVELITLVQNTIEEINEANHFEIDEDLVTTAIVAGVIISIIGGIVALTNANVASKKDGHVLTTSAEVNLEGFGYDIDTTNNGILSLKASRVLDKKRSGGKYYYYNTTELSLRVQTGSPKKGTIMIFNDSSSAKPFTVVPFETNPLPGSTNLSDSEVTLQLPLFVTKVQFGKVDQ
jgi:hypothetical protein